MIPETPKTVLLVDDHKNLLITLGDYLEFRGFRVLRARSGEEALVELEKQPVDIIILDIGMPGMGGLGFLKRITREDGSLQYPVLVLTAKSAMEEFFGSMPVDGFLAKPCPEREVLEKVREILARKAAQAAPNVKRILIVEDDPVSMARLREAFESAEKDFVVETVPTGMAVIEHASRTQPACIVINEVLTGTSGSKLAALLGARSATRKIPIVLFDPTHTVDTKRLRHFSTPGRPEKFISTSAPEAIVRATRELLMQP